MKNESESYPFIQISLFSATLSIVIAFSFYVARFGLSERYTHSLLGFVGLSFVLILSPIFFRKNLSNNTGYANFFLNDTILPLYLLLIFCLIGSFAEFESSFVSIMLFSIGTILYVIVAFRYIKQTKIITIIISLGMTFIFGVYLSSVYWTLLADPLYLENMSEGKSHMDPLFHSSIAQMVKTYSRPSTGIDLTPLIRYHFGSHYLIGKLSKFSNIAVIEFYNFGYAIIFLPLLLRSMLSFIVVFQRTYLTLRYFKLNFLFWALLFAPFIGFISFDGNSIALNSGIGYQIIIYSESYSISFIYTFVVLTSIVTFGSAYLKNPQGSSLTLIAILIFLPFLIIIGGITKVSTLFLVVSCCSYLFIRLKLYKKWYFVISMLITVAGSFLVFTLTNDARDQEGSFYFFQFVKDIIESRWFVFLPVYYSLTLVFCVLTFLGEKLYNLQNIKSAVTAYRTLPVEILLLIAIVGFVPGAILKFYQGNSQYFSEFQYWIASSFILAYLYQFVEKIKPLFTNKYKLALIPLAITGLYIGYKMDRNWAMYWRRAVDRNLNDRMGICKSFPASYPARLQLTKAIRTVNLKKTDSLINALSAPVQIALTASDRYNFIQNLKKLDTLSVSQKEKHLIYVEHLQTSNLMECYKIPFLFPALTGMALYKGLPSEDCIGAESYGYETYKEIEKQNGPDAIADNSKLSEYKSIIVIDIQKYTLEVISKDELFVRKIEKL